MSVAAMQKSEVKEHPILFSAPMVRAILEGRKTQTRRVINTFPKWMHEGKMSSDIPVIPELTKTMCDIWLKNCRYGKVGDRLWVRETWRLEALSLMPTSIMATERERVVYRADQNPATDGWKWRPSIYMPRALSRITLEITDVRIQRIQDISEDDIHVEGFTVGDGVWAGSLRAAFIEGWNKLNAKRGYSFESNPFVWCISFKRISM